METIKNASCKECLSFGTGVCRSGVCAKCMVLNIAPDICSGVESCRTGMIEDYKDCKKFKQKIGDWDA